MSLINDALKRTSQKQNDPGAGQSGGGGTPMTPVDNSPGSGPNFVLIVLLLLCVIGGGYYFMKWKQSRNNAGLAKTAPPKAAATTNGILGAAALIRQTTNLVGQIRARQAEDTSMQQAAKSTNLVAMVKTNAPAAKTTPSMAESTNAEVASTSVPVSPAPAEPVKTIPSAPAPSGTFPTLKLQGIFYRLRNPTVLINGETMKIGDNIGGAKVVEINRTDAKVEWNGQIKVLPLPPE